MNKVLVCDLDGTLIKTDMLLESVFILLKNNPIYLLIIPFWLVKGRQILKSEIEKRISLNPENLPYNYDVIKFLKDNKEKFNQTVLVSASNENIVKKISDYLKLFSESYGSNDKINLKSKNKSKFLDEKYGQNNWSYIGDSKADIEVWNKSNESYIVNNNNSRSIKSVKFNEVIGEKSKSTIKLIVKEIRVYQWVKNLLLFIPALMAHQTSSSLYIEIIFAFLAFSVLASSVYVLNDLLDLDADRLHPRKKNRPFASGNLSLAYGFLLLPVLILLSFSISILYLPLEFTLTLFVYYLITNLYSFKLKRIEIVDIITLGVLYTIRIIAGGFAVDIEITPWLLAFSMFLFVSLALLKRYTELLSMIKENKTKASGRAYYIEDIDIIRTFGTAASYLAILVFALYVNSDQVKLLYNKPIFMWVIAILLLYWITRLWLLAHRGKMTDDPIVFTGKDFTSWIIGLLIGAIVIFAKL